jgi:hypothetical protein
MFQRLKRHVTKPDGALDHRKIVHAGILLAMILICRRYDYSYLGALLFIVITFGDAILSERPSSSKGIRFDPFCKHMMSVMLIGLVLALPVYAFDATPFPLHWEKVDDVFVIFRSRYWYASYPSLSGYWPLIYLVYALIVVVADTRWLRVNALSARSVFLLQSAIQLKLRWLKVPLIGFIFFGFVAISFIGGDDPHVKDMLNLFLDFVSVQAFCTLLVLFVFSYTPRARSMVEALKGQTAI